MPFERVSTILREADNNNTAVIAFNCFDCNTIYAAIYGAQEVHKPVIIMLYPTMYTLMSLRAFSALVRDQAERVSVPVGLHLDHCADRDFIKEAVEAGFNSVMADGSMLPFDENAAFTRSIVEMVKGMDVDVEGELGIIGRGPDALDDNPESQYTTPEQVTSFIEKTGVDSLAIAIGSAHGFYKNTPTLDLDRLAAINKVTDLPLVLHGGSGIPEDQLRKAFVLGINKFNVGTEYMYLNKALTRDYFTSSALDDDACSYVGYVRANLQEYICHKLELTKIHYE